MPNKATCTLLLMSAAMLPTIPALAQAQAKGGVRGQVTLKGQPPARKALTRDTDPVCAKSERLDEAIVADGGKLRDVLVRISNGSAGKHATPSAPATLTQTDCMYTPRVVGVMVGQKLAIKNGDPTYHNVRSTVAKEPWFNLAQPSAAPDIVRDVTGKAGDVVELHCDVHPWMTAFLPISDHPFFSVTTDDGSYSLAGVPAGRYTVEAWHPVLGLQKKKVRIRAGKPAKLDFAFTAPSP